jgi:hypothetical protein
MSKGITIPSHFKEGMFGTTVILNDDSWNDGELRLMFRPHIVATTTEDVTLERPTKFLDLIAAEVHKEASYLKNSKDYDIAIEKALGEEESKTQVIPKGYEINIFGSICIFRGEKYQKGALGSLENPLCIGSPTLMPYVTVWPAKKLMIDWLALNGSDRDFFDISMFDLIVGYYNTKMQNAPERKILLPWE